MNFNNLKKNILYHIGDRLILKREKVPFKISTIYKEFADIPQQNIEEALSTLERKDLISISKYDTVIALTGKGFVEFKRSFIS